MIIESIVAYIIGVIVGALVIYSVMPSRHQIYLEEDLEQRKLDRELKKKFDKRKHHVN